LKIQVNKEKDWKRTLEIEIEKERVDSEYEQVFKDIKIKSKIPGFRQGKAPMDLIKSRFKDLATEDVRINLIKQALKDALEEVKLEPISTSDIILIPPLENIELEPGLPLKFKAEIEVLPQIDVKDYRGLAVTKKKFEVKDEDVEKNIKYLKEQNATLKPVERKAKEGDFILVDLEKFPAKNIKEEKAKDQQVFLGKQNLLPEFFDAFKNSQAGEQKEFEVFYPTDYRDKELAGKKVKYKVKIKEIKEKVFPEVDDIFAKSLGFSDYLDMRFRIKKDLERKAEQESLRDLKAQLVKKVIEKNSFEVPKSLLKDYLDSVVDDFKKSKEKIDEKKIRAQNEKVGKDRIRWIILLQEIAKKERVEVTSDDVKDWIKKFAQNYNLTQEKAKEILAKGKKLEDIKESILEDKVLDLLLRNAIIVEEEKIERSNP